MSGKYFYKAMQNMESSCSSLLQPALVEEFTEKKEKYIAANDELKKRP